MSSVFYKIKLSFNAVIKYKRNNLHEFQGEHKDSSADITSDLRKFYKNPNAIEIEQLPMIMTMKPFSDLQNNIYTEEIARLENILDETEDPMKVVNIIRKCESFHQITAEEGYFSYYNADKDSSKWAKPNYIQIYADNTYDRTFLSIAPAHIEFREFDDIILCHYDFILEDEDISQLLEKAWVFTFKLNKCRSDLMKQVSKDIGKLYKGIFDIVDSELIIPSDDSIYSLIGYRKDIMQTILEDEDAEDLPPFFVYLEVVIPEPYESIGISNRINITSIGSDDSDQGITFGNLLYSLAGSQEISERSRNDLMGTQNLLDGSHGIISINNGLNLAVANVKDIDTGYHESYLNAFCDYIELLLKEQELKDRYTLTGRRKNTDSKDIRSTLSQRIGNLLNKRRNEDLNKAAEDNMVLENINYADKLERKISFYSMDTNDLYPAFMKGAKGEFVLNGFKHHLEMIRKQIQEDHDEKENSLLNQIGILAIISAFCDAYSLIDTSMMGAITLNGKVESFLTWIAITCTLVMFYLVIHLFYNMHKSDGGKGKPWWKQSIVAVIAIAAILATTISIFSRSRIEQNETKPDVYTISIPRTDQKGIFVWIPSDEALLDQNSITPIEAVSEAGDA